MTSCSQSKSVEKCGASTASLRHLATANLALDTEVLQAFLGRTSGPKEEEGRYRSVADVALAIRARRQHLHLTKRRTGREEGRREL